MKKLIFLIFLFLSACATETKTWVITDRAQFDADYKHCYSAALAFGRGDQFVTQCMVLKGYNIETKYE